MKIISHSEETTLDFARGLAYSLEGGEVLALVGNLGAGKTAFTRGLAKALGVKHSVTSPTFVLMKTYPINHKQIKLLVHIDAYRLQDGSSLADIGATDYFGQSDTVVVIEWADRVKRVLPKSTRYLKFKHRTGSRVIEY